MCNPAIPAIIMGVVSAAMSAAQASQAARQQADANQRAAEQAAAKATAQNLQANAASRQKAAVEARQRLDVQKQASAQAGANVTSAAQQGLQGNYLADVSQALNLSEAEQQSAITVQSLFGQQAARYGAANTAQSNLNMVDTLPRGGSAGLAIGQAVVGGLSTGLSVYGAAADSGLFGGKAGTETFVHNPSRTVPSSPPTINPASGMPWG